MKRLAIILALVGGSVGAEPFKQWLSGSDLHEFCKEPSGTGRFGCYSYVLGALDGFENQRRFDAGERPNFCLPPNADRIQVTDIVAKYLKDTPEIRHHAATFAVRTAMEEAFPCPQYTPEELLKDPD